MTNKDIRIFYNKRTKDYIIANDYKMRRLMDQGYSIREAKSESHGHIRNKETAERIKDNILANKRETSRSEWILGCYIRVTDNEYKHYNWTKGLYETIKSRDKKYFYRVNRGGIR